MKTTQYAVLSRSTGFGFNVRAALLIAVSVGVLASLSARADEIIGDTRTTKVKLTDLDLSSVQGQKIAQARLREVARTMCNRVSDELDLSRHSNYLKCVETSLGQATVGLQALVSQQSSVRVAQATK